MTIDLRSDAVSEPTAAMREAMASAEVGDGQRREDPTALALAPVGANREEALARLQSVGVLCSRGAGASAIRAMTHRGVDRVMIDEALSRVSSMLRPARERNRTLVAAPCT
ncbi:MAG: beta-eliminating lyase-related protein [Gaiellaceae bacterium]